MKVNQILPFYQSLGTPDCVSHYPERATLPGSRLLQAFPQSAFVLYQMSTTLLDGGFLMKSTRFILYTAAIIILMIIFVGCSKRPAIQNKQHHLKQGKLEKQSQW